MPGAPRQLVKRQPNDRHVNGLRVASGVATREDDDFVSGVPKRSDQRRSDFLDAPDLAVARAEEGYPHRASLGITLDRGYHKSGSDSVACTTASTPVALTPLWGQRPRSHPRVCISSAPRAFKSARLRQLVNTWQG